MCVLMVSDPLQAIAGEWRQRQSHTCYRVALTHEWTDLLLCFPVSPQDSPQKLKGLQEMFVVLTLMEEHATIRGGWGGFKLTKDRPLSQTLEGQASEEEPMEREVVFRDFQ